jgi:serine acetyltransferase
MKPIVKLMFISALAAMSSSQAAPIVLHSDLTANTIAAETYSASGAGATIRGDIVSGTYTSIGAAALLNKASTRYEARGAGIKDGTITGDVDSGTYVSTGANSEVGGNVDSGTYVSTGDSAKISGSVDSGTYTKTGANSTVVGDIDSGTTVTLGAGSNAQNVYAKVSVGGATDASTVSISVDLGGTKPAKTNPSLGLVIKAEQKRLKDLGGVVGSGAINLPGAGATTYDPAGETFQAGIYNIADIFSVTASSFIKLKGKGLAAESWVFNIANYMVWGAGSEVELENVHNDSNIIWNILGDSTGGADLGSAVLGAGVNFTGSILANTFISVGAYYPVNQEGAYVTDAGSNCGGLYSATSYVSVGALSIIGGENCAERAAPLLAEGIAPSAVPTPATALLFGLGLGLIGLVGVARRKKA